jgi:hypothetical protein
MYTANRCSATGFLPAPKVFGDYVMADAWMRGNLMTVSSSSVSQSHSSQSALPATAGLLLRRFREM